MRSQQEVKKLLDFVKIKFNQACSIGLPIDDLEKLALVSQALAWFLGDDIEGGKMQVSLVDEFDRVRSKNRPFYAKNGYENHE